MQDGIIVALATALLAGSAAPSTALILQASAAEPVPQVTAAPQPSPVETLVAPTGAGASQFDGVYRGTMTSVGRGGGTSPRRSRGQHESRSLSGRQRRWSSQPWEGQGARCRASQDDASVIVRDGVVRRRWSGNPVEAAVRPDGSFGTVSRVARMRGQITGQGMTMDLEINGPACIERYTLAGS